MKAHLFAMSLWGLAARAAVHQDIAGLAARQAIPSNAAVSVCYTYASTYLTLVTPTTSGGLPTPTPPAFFPVILAIEPLAIAKRDLEKRAGLGGYVRDDPADPNALNCTAATIFQLQVGGGLFLDQGLSLFTTVGAAFQEFRATGPAPAGGLTTFFSGQDGSVLTWTNAAFFGGAATFCQVPFTGQVYATFEGQTDVPVGCVTVQLRIYAASRCNNGVINGGGSSSASSTTATESLTTSSAATATDLTSSTVTEAPSSSAASTTDLTSSTVTEAPSSSAASTTDLTSSTVTEAPSSSAASTTDLSSTVIVTPSSSAASTTDLTSSTVTEAPSSSAASTTDLSSTVIVTPSSSAASTTDLTSSTVIQTVSSTTITDTGSSTTPAPTSSTPPQITLTSTSTETTYVVVSSTTSAGSAATSAAGCTFSTSGSLILNGGFENPSSDPFAFAPLGVLPIPTTKKRGTVDKRVTIVPDADAASTLNIVSSASAPEPYAGLCNYVLQIAFPGGAIEQVIDVYGTIIQNTSPSQEYSLSFDILVCGATGNVYVTINDYTSSTFDGQDCTPGGNGAWQTVTGTFTSSVLDVLDYLYIHYTGDVDSSQAYFDNFIVKAVTA